MHTISCIITKLCVLDIFLLDTFMLFRLFVIYAWKIECIKNAFEFLMYFQCDNTQKQEKCTVQIRGLHFRLKGGNFLV